jgi:O-antigen/teichoic acid export membrane protein
MSISEEKEILSLKDKTAKGLLWGGIGSFLQQAIGLVFGILILRILSPDDYGLVAMLSIFIALANSIMDSGFSTALVNRKVIQHKDYNAVFWFSLFSGLLIYILLFFSAPLIAKFYKQPVLINLSRLLFLSFLFSSLGIAHNAFLLKNIMAKQRGIIDFCSVLCSGVIGLILALNGYVFWGLAIQTITQSFVSTILRWFFSSWRPTFEIDFSPLKEMFSFSFKVLMTNIIALITANILSIVFGRYYGTKQTGYYSQGNKWASLGSTVINGMLLNVAQPVLVQANDDKERLVNIFRKMIRFGAFISFPCLLGLAFIGKEFILIAVGEKWIDSLFFLQSFCVWGSFSFIWLLYINMLLSLHKSNIYMWSILFLSILQIGVVVCMISASIKIMTIIYILSNFVGILFCHYHINKLIGLRLRDVIKDIFPYLFTTLFSIFVGWLVVFSIDYNNYLNLLIKIVVVVLLYVIIMKKSKSVTFKESINYLEIFIKF